MTTTLYMIRHCEAMGNKQRLFQGSIDLDISEIGAKQLTFLRKRFSEIELDTVYSSPLIRAQKTAHAVADDKHLPIRLCDGLRELSGGVLEGRPFQEGFDTIPGLADIWNNHPQDFEPEGGEKMRDAYERIWNTVLGIAKENPGKRIAAATHGGALRCLICRLIKGNIEELKSIPWSDNTAIAKIEFDENWNPTLCYFNDHSHVPPEFMPVHSRIAGKIEE